MLAQTSGFPKLDEWVETWKAGQQTFFGYPVNQQSEMRDFYEWYGKGNRPMGSRAYKGSAGVLCKAIRMLREWAEQEAESEN